MPIKRFIKYFSGTTQINLQKFNRMSEENVENITKSDNNFGPAFVDHHLLPNINLKGNCLMDNISIPKKINLYIPFTLSPWLRNLNTDFILNNLNL